MIIYLKHCIGHTIRRQERRVFQFAPGEGGVFKTYSFFGFVQYAAVPERVGLISQTHRRKARKGRRP